ncbi:hypothetical protein EM864_02845 [Stenotrophomonas acidaminiphila]|uniref:hypothetical protein n=1 Tax=Stenotrophomonas acidaminiphila TaxID=128780 RepID=UPI00240619F1|nr:hypothetical protein [Stenotrophomonas acidaminiphila]MDF9440689.1 hypothetical protein [Stenotrophomonas acidaminiphila]
MSSLLLFVLLGLLAIPAFFIVPVMVGRGFAQTITYAYLVFSSNAPSSLKPSFRKGLMTLSWMMAVDLLRILLVLFVVTYLALQAIAVGTTYAFIAMAFATLMFSTLLLMAFSAAMSEPLRSAVRR